MDRTFLRTVKRPHYEKLKPKLKIADLFCGCGGLSLGLAEAARGLGFGLSVRLAVDMDQVAVSVYRRNFPDANVHCARVEELFHGALGSQLSGAERKLARAVGDLDVLVGGPPCQGHSDLNNHTRRSDPRNALYTRIARAAAVLRPNIVAIENVPTVKHAVERVVEIATKALVELGYGVHDEVIDLGRLGAPQRRRRHVLLAIKGNAERPREVLKSVMDSCAAKKARTVRWAIEDLADMSGTAFDTASTASKINAKRISYLFDHDVYDLPNRLRPVCHQSDHSYRSMYGRLRWDEPAQTVTTGFGSMGQGRYVHPIRPRTLTPHEAARLQMIPDFFDLSGVQSRGALATLIGNTVPPVLGFAIGRTILLQDFGNDSS